MKVVGKSELSKGLGAVKTCFQLDFVVFVLFVFGCLEVNDQMVGSRDSSVRLSRLQRICLYHNGGSCSEYLGQRQKNQRPPTSRMMVKELGRKATYRPG